MWQPRRAISVNIEKETRARFLVMMAMGIGDAVAVGLSAIDQIIKNEPVVRRHQPRCAWLQPANYSIG